MACRGQNINEDQRVRVRADRESDVEVFGFAGFGSNLG